MPMMKLGATWTKDISGSLPSRRAGAVFMSTLSIIDLQPVLVEEQEGNEGEKEAAGGK